MNPFGDSSSDESDGFNPFTTKKSVRTNNTNTPNPFDNDDDDDDDEMGNLNKPAVTLIHTVKSSSSNPFENDAPAAASRGPSRAKSTRAVAANPFSENDNPSMNRPKSAGTKLRVGMKKKVEEKKPIHSPNPFDTSPEKKNSLVVNKKTTIPTPFDAPPPTKAEKNGMKNSNSVPNKLKTTGTLNPFEESKNTSSSKSPPSTATATAVRIGLKEPGASARPGASVRTKPASTKKSLHVRSKTTSEIKTMHIDPFESNPPKRNNGAATSTSKSSNQFDFEPNFNSTETNNNRIKKERGLFGPSKKIADGGASVPMAAKVDLDTSMLSTNDTTTPHAMLTSAQLAAPKTQTLNVNAKNTRPGFLSNRAKSDATGIAGNLKAKPSNNSSAESTALKGWLRGNKALDEGKAQQAPSKSKSTRQAGNDASALQRANQQRGAKKKKKKRLTVKCWPYDDYHKEQEQYYQSIPESAPDMNLRRRHAKEGDRKENETVRKEQDRLYERPSELPRIQEAVQNLSLLDFENKAEERAISIVSTWLFDAGLIDELLVHGGVPSSNRYLNRTRAPGSGMSLGDRSGASGYTNNSVRSSEGVEVGVQGFPIEGSMKIEKEIEKLRSSAQRELTLINTRLNDGVSASGAEVQELVNAVSATKNELGRLRELTTYISSGYKKDYSNRALGGSDGFLLSEFPRLKRVINARRNIFRCFRELEFFSQIPMTCDRLREELHQGEWTDNEWNTIRNVCMEHVELEILLVEAEAGMKAWLDDEEDEGDDDATLHSMRSNRSLKKSWKGKNSNSSLSGNYAGVDEFLSQHVKNVWELGDEIRMRILSGIGSAFSLALENPAGMVALVEAVEVYERAAEEYKASRIDDESTTGGDRNRLHFTDMRAAALSQLFQDFELRGLEVFRAIHMQAADMAGEDDALTSQFNAVLRAATELVTEIDVVKNQMAPCFAPHWHVEMLWSSCVAHVCSNNIIQQIGGPEGQNLPELTVNQLLDLVAWVEFFRETIEESFPSIVSMHSKKTHLCDILQGDKKGVNVENATDSLAWVNNMLWEVHRLAQDEFLLRTRSQTEDWLNNVYKAEHETRQSNEGRLMTSLCEDVFSLATVQLRTIRERLTKKSEALVMAVCSIFSLLRAKQISSRDQFLHDFETCCSAANDFQRMGEECEDVLQDLIGHCSFPDELIKMLEESCGELVSVYSADAVFSAQKAQSFIFEPIWNAISDDLFGPKWETDLTHNELALTLTRTLVSKDCLLFNMIASPSQRIRIFHVITNFRRISWQIWSFFWTSSC
jgi:hypothetical protein